MSAPPLPALAEFIAGGASRRFDDSYAEATRRGVLDWCGVALAGSREPVGRLVAELGPELGTGDQASLVGSTARASAANAALINGTAGHALDFDDTNLETAVHATAAVLPAALAVAERCGASGDALLRSYATGYEVAVYFGELLYPQHFEAAWHATAVFGTLGAAAAAAALLGLDPARTTHALGLAATQAAGLRAMFGSMAKPLHAGRAASGGVLSALLAERGVTAAAEPLEGRFGLLRALGAAEGETAAVLPPSAWTRLRSNDLKLHACCHATHAAVDAALEIRSRAPWQADDIALVEVDCSLAAGAIAANPAPTTGLEGKFSIAYAVLTALLEGDASGARFSDERVRADGTRALLGRVRVRPSAERAVKEARVTVRRPDGTSLTATVTAPRGSWQNPASWDELVTKFRSLADPVLGPDRAATLERTIRGLPATASARELAALLVPR